jgi:toxin CptA
MHSAPSVSYPVGRSRFAAAFLLLIWLGAAAATGLWGAQLQAASWRLGAAALVLAATGLWAAWNWCHAPAGTLAWDGDAWNWSEHSRTQPAEPIVSLDLQRCLLLRCRTGESTRWLWLERGWRTERWDDLRRALYSRARPQALRLDEPPR